MVKPRTGRSPGSVLPTSARLNEPIGPGPPWTGFGSIPSPALNRDGLGQNSAKGLSASPTLKMRNIVSDRMPGLLFGLNFWTYKASLNSPLAYSGQASVELDEHLSAYPALRADHMTGG